MRYIVKSSDKATFKVDEIEQYHNGLQIGPFQAVSQIHSFLIIYY